jgi:hypothetical protein
MISWVVLAVIATGSTPAMPPGSKIAAIVG